MIVGIDPGKVTGQAVVIDGRLLIVRSDAIHVAIKDVLRFSHDYDAFVVVEDARKRKWFGNSGPEKWKGAGSIMRDCTIWEDFLVDMKIRHLMVAPAPGNTKLGAAKFQQAYGWTHKTNEHGRDAAMLALRHIGADK